MRYFSVPRRRNHIFVIFSGLLPFFLIVLLLSVSNVNAQIWEDFTVWYDGNGADSGHLESEIYKSGSNDITLKENIAGNDSSDEPFVKQGCNFLGWSLVPNESESTAITPILPGGSVWDPMDVPVTWNENKGGFVFYARWDCDTIGPVTVNTPVPVQPTATSSLLIGPSESGNAATPTQQPVQAATPTASLLIYPNSFEKLVSKDGAAEMEKAETDTRRAAIPKLFFSSGDELTPLPETGITSRTVFSRSQKPASIEYKPLNMELQIPSLEIRSQIVAVESDENGYPIQWLQMDTGLLAETDLPGSGFSVLAAHNTLDSDTYGPFALIRALRQGDRFFIRTQENELMIFEVYGNEKINEYDYEALYKLGSQYENTVTLMTCEDERIEGSYMNRRIISARKIN